MNRIALLIWIAGLCLGLAGVYTARGGLEKHGLRLTAAVVFLAGAVLYHRFLTGASAYLYAVSDGYAQYLPNYMNYVRALLEGGGLPHWTFSVGFGAVQSYDALLYPLNLIPVLTGAAWGEQALMICFAWMQVIKMTLAAAFMYLFLKQLSFRPCTGLLCGVLYGLCGIMVLRGFWIFLADECYIAVFLLYSVERYFRQGKWSLVPLAVFLVANCFGVYHLYLYGLLLVVYTTVRYIYARRPAKGFLPFLLSSGGLFLLGACLWGVLLIGFGWTMFTTARFDDAGTRLGLSALLSHVSRSVLVSGAWSLFDPGATGVFNRYTGVLNYLERPLFYSGLITVFLIPQAFVLGTRRERKLLSFGVLAAVVYMLFPFVTDVCNAFIRNEELHARSYRQSTLWIMILLVVMAGCGLECVLRRGRFHRPALLITAGGLCLVLLFLCWRAPSYGVTVAYDAVGWAAAFLLVWTVLLYVSAYGAPPRRARMWMILLVCAALAETGHSAGLTIRGAAAAADTSYAAMSADPTGYYGDTAQALAYLHSYDGGFYRVSGVHSATGASGYCTPLYFGVHDSSYYTNTDGGTYAFLKEVYPQAFTNGIGAKYAMGVGDDAALSTLTGYKYRLVFRGSGGAAPAGYRLIKTVGSVDIYENQQALSVGLSYDTYMKQSDFQTYSDEEQRLLLLACVVLPDDAGTPLRRLEPAEASALLAGTDDAAVYEAVYQRCSAARQAGMLQVSAWREDRITGSVHMDGDGVLCLSIPRVPGWTVRVDGAAAAVETANIGFMGVSLTAGDHLVELLYRPAALAPGTAVSVCALAVYAALLALRKKIRWPGLYETPNAAPIQSKIAGGKTHEKENRDHRGQ